MFYKIIQYVKNHKLVFILCLIVIFSVSLLLKIYKFNYKYKSSDKITRIEAVVEELYKIKDDRVSYVVKYNRR